MTQVFVDRSKCTYKIHLVSCTDSSVDTWEFKTLTDFVDRCLALGVSPSEYAALNQISIDPYVVVDPTEFDNIVSWVQLTQGDRKSSICLKSYGDGMQEVVLRIIVNACALNDCVILDNGQLRVSYSAIRELLSEREKFNQLIAG